jgi:hypothetical protein
MATTEEALPSAAPKFTPEDLAFIRDNILPKAAAPAEVERARPRRAAKKRQGLFDDILPAWGYRVGDWFVEQRDLGWRVAGLIVAVFVLLPLALVAVFGNGLASINGLRIPLRAFGLNVDAVPWPAWVILPVIIFLVQVVIRHIPALRWLWRPTMIYDGATTSMFIALGILTFQASHGREPILWLVGVFSALLGLLFAFSERLLTGVVAILIRLARR